MEERHRLAARTDTYALFPGSGTVGLKLRDSRLEIKALGRMVGPRRFAPAVQISGEIWVRLAMTVPEGDALNRVMGWRRP